MPPTAPDFTVRRLMTTDPARVEPDQPVRAALDLMNSRRVGAVLVADAADHVVGIFTERDFLRHALETSGIGQRVPVRDWMSPSPYTIHPDAGWEEAVDTFERLRVRHLPVVEHGKLVGIVTTRNLMAQRSKYLNAMVAERTREVRQANDALMSRDAEVNHYIQAAARLQKRLVLPQSPPDWPEMAWGTRYAPLDPLGGDLYGFARPDDDHLGILIADASGHGIPAAMVAILARQAFVEAAGRTVRPGEVLAAMNERLQGMTDERFVTAFYGVLERKTRKLTYANAGHPSPVWYSASRKGSSELSANGFLLGIMPEEVYVEKCVELGPGDRLCFFTDGLPDCRDERGETFGTDRVKTLMGELAGDPADKLAENFDKRLSGFRGTAKPVDDMTLLVAGVN